MTILIVEDDEGISELLQEKLEDYGYDTVGVQFAGEGLAYLEAHSPDLLVLDYSLPDMNGQEFIAELKERALPLPVFIVSTGHGDERIAVEMMKLGARDYVVKDSHFLERVPEVIRRVDKEVQNEHKLKQAEDALRESEIKFRTMFESSRDAIGVSKDGLHTLVNPAYLQMFGYDHAEELIREPIVNCIAVAEHERIIAMNQAHKRGENAPRAYETRGRRKDDSEFDMDVQVSIYILNGKEYSLIILRNITERKQVEEQIRNHNALLEEAVQEKTKEMELLTKRLLQQEKLATIGQISGSIAHELRNPLGTIKQSVFYLNLLHAEGMMESTNTTVSEHLALIENEVETTNQVINSLLESTRTKVPTQEQINLKKITLEALQRSHLKNQLQLQFNLKPDPFLISADPLQFQQVLINVLTNASQAASIDALVTVTACLLPTEKQVQIQIQDNGPGLDPETLSQVFEPLFTTKIKGTGLGLSICKQIIENHQGSMTLSSEVGQGTVVEIMLPVISQVVF